MIGYRPLASSRSEKLIGNALTWISTSPGPGAIGSIGTMVSCRGLPGRVKHTARNSPGTDGAAGPTSIGSSARVATGTGVRAGEAAGADAAGAAEAGAGADGAVGRSAAARAATASPWRPRMNAVRSTIVG